jgi:(2R)-sulfolactate sulfo-lyase subunit alpha
MTKEARVSAKRAESASAREKGAIPHVLAHSPKDNVAVVAVEGLTAGTDALGVVTEDNSSFTVAVKHDIPIGHKIALADLEVGDTAIKYGHDVGRIVQPVKKGEHVHVHNLKTKRW